MRCERCLKIDGARQIRLAGTGRIADYRGKMNHRINSGHGGLQLGAITHVAADKFEIGVRPNA